MRRLDLADTKLSVTPDSFRDAKLPAAAGIVLTGTDGDDVLTGTADDDTIHGNDGEDLIYGGDGDDLLFGDRQNDRIYGDDGNDTIEGGHGHDILHGGAGLDLILGGDGRDNLYGDDGNDTLLGGDGADRLFGGNGDDRLEGGLDDDLLSGNDGADILHGEEGSDRLLGGIGADNLYGGDGDDTLLGEAGEDRLFGGAGDDDLDGGAGDDLLAGNDGHDILRGGDGSDRMLGDIGRDNLYGDAGNDTLNGGAGADRLFGGDDNDRVEGGLGNDLLAGNDGADVLHGNEGHDRLLGGAGIDNLYGDDGRDTLLGGAGNDRLFGGAHNDDLDGGADDDLVAGNDGHDILHGGDGDDRVLGGAGRDQLFGDDGNDDLLGGSGADSLTGGAGNDEIDGGEDSDTAIFSGNFTDYSLSLANGILTVNGPDGTDSLVSVERLQFDDRTILLDLTGSAAPVFSSAASASVAENQTAAYGAAATDADAGATLSYFLFGPDAALFDIDSATGVVTFKTAPDFELPGDTGGDNVHDITVRVFDGANTIDQAVAIRVTNLSETIDLTTLTAGQGFIIQGDVAGDQAGHAVSSAGDVNGDGYADLIIGANLGDDGGFNAGEAYVVFGSATGFGVDVSGRQVVDLTTLTASQGFIIQGDTSIGYAGDEAGYSVSSAGDVNGDGYDDLIVGAYGGDDGGTSAGEAYVVFGSASGFGVDVGGRQVIDLTSLSASEGFIIQGDYSGDRAGRSVSGAGDINGDGYADLIIGAPRGSDANAYAGEAYVVFGTASGFGAPDGDGRQVIDLTSLSEATGFVIQADRSGDYAGFSASAAGDVNGDGYDDLIIGAPYGDDGGTHAGEAYVVFGSASGFGAPDDDGRQVVDLAQLSASEGFIIQGDDAFDQAGWSVSSAGDVNGDGYDDLIVGAGHGGAGAYNPGEAYVVFGSASGFGSTVTTTASTGGYFDRQVIDVSTLSAAEGFIIRGDANDEQAGRSVSSAGDVNGDGYDDLIVGVYLGDDGGIDAGEAYVVFGSATGFGSTVTTGGYDRQVIDLGIPLTAAEGFIIQGDVAGDRAGRSVSAAGDVNGDGYDDLIVGARAVDDGGNSAGAAYVVFGGPTGSVTGLVAAGTASANDMAGSAGDDILTGAGGADVIRGGAGDDVIGVSDTGFFRIDGGGGDDTLRLDGAGVDLDLGSLARNALTAIERIDLAGSGDNSLTLSLPDIYNMMAARESGSAILRVTGDAGDHVDLADGGWTLSGLVVEGAVTYGRYVKANAEVLIQDGVTVIGVPAVLIDLTDLTSSQGFIIQGDLASQAGYSVSSAGDINGDGYDDMIVGAHRGNDGGNAAGEAYVVFGSASGFGTADGAGRQVIDLTTLSSSQGFIIQGDAAGDAAGNSVSSAGDINGDGYDDLIVGAQYGDDGGSYAGEAYVLFGSASGFGVDVSGRQVIDLTSLSADDGFMIQGDGTLDYAGRSVSSAGDVNGDGYDDLIIGANGGDDGGSNAGEAYVAFGSASGFGTTDGAGRQVIDLTTLSSSQGFIIQGDAAGDQAGWSVSSAGDFNGDGYDDLIVGAYQGDDGGSGAGEAYVVFGAASGFGADVAGRQVIDLTTLTPGQGFIIQGDLAGDQAGRSVSGAGDVNGDGYDDLIIGGPRAWNAGEAYVVFGSAAGIGVDVSGRQVLDLTSLTAGQGFVIEGEFVNDQAGRSVSSAGDVNGDGYDDLIIGAPDGSNGGSDAGQAYVVFGSASGFGVDVSGRQVIRLSALSASEGFVIQGDMAYDRAGESVSGAGDVNGDGYDDLMVGAYRGDDGGSYAGEAYVVFGAATGSTAGLIATGTAGANIMTGAAGDDTLSGAGGADVIRGGAGNDVISVSDAGFQRIDGGHGDDTLRVDGAGMALDFLVITQNAVTGIERIDLTGSGDNTLTLTALDVFDMVEARTDGVAILRVNGEAGDSVNLTDAGWASAGTVVEDAITYDRYTLGNAEVRIEAGMLLWDAAPIDPGKPDGGIAVMDVIDADARGEAVLREAAPDGFVSLGVHDGGLASFKTALWQRGYHLLDSETPWGDIDHHGQGTSLRGEVGPAVHTAFASSVSDHTLALPTADAQDGLTLLSETGPLVDTVPDGIEPVDTGLFLADTPAVVISGPAPAGDLSALTFFPSEMPFDLALPDMAEGWH